MSAPVAGTPGHALSAAADYTVSQARNLLFPAGVPEDLDIPDTPAPVNPLMDPWLAHMREAIGDTVWLLTDLDG